MQTEEGFTLTKATVVSRKFLKVGGLSILAFLVLRFSFLSFVAYWKATHPPPPPPPTVGFGTLPAPIFPESDPASKPKQYVLETKNGRLPGFDDRAKVFLMPKTSPNLFDHENALKIAEKFNFKFEPQIVDNRTYRWQKTTPLLTTLELDILDHVFSYQTEFMNRPELILTKQNLTRFDANQQTQAFLSKADLLPGDIASSSGKLTYLKASGSQLLEVATPLDADYVQVDIQRTPVDGAINFYTQKGEEGIVSAILGSIKGLDSSVVSIRYSYYPVDYNQVHTYPLRDVKLAWNVVQGGESYVVSNKNPDRAVIREVTLAYYDNLNGQDYLQPIYVFQGDDDFMAFVPAIDSKYLQNSKQ